MKRVIICFIFSFCAFEMAAFAEHYRSWWAFPLFFYGVLVGVGLCARGIFLLMHSTWKGAKR